MKIKTIIAIITVFVLGLVGTALAFNCETTQRVCENNFDYQGDCCRSSELLSPSYFCSLNETDCKARIKAEVHKNSDLGIYYFLKISSEDPSNWYKLSSEDRSKFLECVNNNIINDEKFWVCSYDLIDLDGISRNLYMDQNLIKEKEPTPIIESNYSQEPIVIEKQGIIESIGEDISNLFSSIGDSIINIITFKWLFGDEDIEEPILQPINTSNSTE